MPLRRLNSRLELLLVSYEVDRADTPMARSPELLLDLGLEEKLQGLGYSTRTQSVRPNFESPEPAQRVAQIQTAVCAAVRAAKRRRRFPVLLSGGCLTALGVSAALRQAGRRISVLWVDAHGDFNTEESSPSGYWDGMALATLCGLALEPLAELIGAKPVDFSSISHLAGRDFDPPERAAFRQHRILVIPPDELAPSFKTPRTSVAGRLRDRIGRSRDLYLHIDLDGLDPTDAPAVAFPVPDGVRLVDLVATLQILPTPGALTLSALDLETASPKTAKQTLFACCELIQAATPPPKPSRAT